MSGASKPGNDEVVVGARWQSVALSFARVEQEET
jgi:hypothetical protein